MRLWGPAWEAAGSGASGGIWATAGSPGLTPHPRAARAEDAVRSPREDESGRGAGALTRASGGRGRRHRTRGDSAPLLSHSTGGTRLAGPEREDRN